VPIPWSAGSERLNHVGGCRSVRFRRRCPRCFFRHRHNHAAQKLTPFLLTVRSPATQDGHHLRNYLGPTTPIHPPGAVRSLTIPDAENHQLLVVSCGRWPTISSVLQTWQHFWQKCINIANGSCIFCSAHVLIALLSNSIGNFFANSKE